MPSRGRQPLWRKIHRPSLAGSGMLERLRSIFFGLLGLSAAGWLLLFAFIAHLGLPTLHDIPIFGPPAQHSAVHRAVIAAGPAGPAGLSVLHNQAASRHSTTGGTQTGGSVAVKAPNRAGPPGPREGITPSKPSIGAGGIGSTGRGTSAGQPTGQPPGAIPTSAPVAVPIAASPPPAPAVEASASNGKSSASKGHFNGENSGRDHGPPAWKEGGNPHESHPAPPPQVPPTPVVSGESGPGQEEPTAGHRGEHGGGQGKPGQGH
jgi:hypothetical protein